MVVQPGLCRMRSEKQIVGFLMIRLKYGWFDLLFHGINHYSGGQSVVGALCEGIKLTVPID